MTHYEIVPDRSVVVIDARSSMHPIHSESSGLEGFLDLDAADGGGLDLSTATKGHLELATSLLKSGNALYDKEMQRRIDSRRFPRITGELVAIASAGAADSYRVRGDLTFHGVTRSYEEDMTISLPDDSTVELTGSHVFDVRDFGIEPPKIMMIKVHPDVTVRIEIKAKKGD